MEKIENKISKPYIHFSWPSGCILRLNFLLHNYNMKKIQAGEKIGCANKI